MNVSVKHNGSNITSHVIKYDREHKICTGVGMLELEVAYTYSASFDPWDSIEIHENGEKVGTYYVSVESESQPSATRTVTAQDNSKRLTDYFISDSYLIDYPSYAKFWIEFFLDEVGINYTFLTEEIGNLLSNNTGLGLTTAYDQILMLLQMNGWYITFNPNGTAIIGRLNADFSIANGGRYGRSDITEIKVIKNDAMLRNRVVVWGNGDPTTSRWVFADVSKPTKWDYDDRDKRTIVISNSNIPNVSSAFLLANKALTEFAKLTVEKHFTLTGARDIMVGDIVKVTSKIFTGKGLCTTFGTSMSAQGLVSNVVLDERCPRLFGFFDMSGFVYVGTYGSGIWRKHILPTWSGGVNGSGLIGFASGLYHANVWYDYSSGIMDMSITDLHVNAGVLVSVAASGDYYYSLEDETPWAIPDIGEGLQVAMSGDLLPLDTGGYDETVYSGGSFLARACIIDRDTNYIRVAVDTRSGVNYGDFLIETDPFAPNYLEMFSYIVPSAGSFVPASGVDDSTFRSWVLDINPYDGTLTEAFPVGISGNYRFLTFDIENDGTNDYIEALTLMSGNMPASSANGFHSSVAFTTEVGPVTSMSFGRQDYLGTLHNFMPYSGFFGPVTQTVTATSLQNVGNLSTHEGVCFLQDGYPLANTYMAAMGNSAGSRNVKVKRIVPNPNGTTTATEFTFITSYATTETFPLAVFQINPNRYRFCFTEGPNTTEPEQNTNLVIVEFDILLNSATQSFYTDALIEKKDGGTRSFHSLMVYGNSVIQATAERTAGLGSAGGGIKFFVRTTSLINGSHSEQTFLDVQNNNISGIGSIIYTGTTGQIMPINGSWVIIGMYTKRTQETSTTFSYNIERYVATVGGCSTSSIFDHKANFGTFSNPYVLTPTGVTGLASTDHRVSVEYGVSGTGSVGNVTFYDVLTNVFNSVDNPATRYRPVQSLGSRLVQQSIAESPAGTFRDISLLTGVSLGTFTAPSPYTLDEVAGFDSFNNDVYFIAYSGSIVAGNKRIIALDKSSGQITRISNMANTANSTEQLRGNFRIGTNNIYWCRPNPLPMKFPVFMVLQRDNYDFNVIKSGLYRDRLELSNYSPLLTMDRRVSSLEAYFISPDDTVSVTSHATMSGHNLGVTSTSGEMFSLGIVSEDLRYSDFDNLVESGTSRSILILYEGNVGIIDPYTMESFSGSFLSPSGYAARIEISNYSLPDQYTFLAVSGYTFSGQSALSGWGFFQRDVSTSGAFVDYSSGYPQARTTIIRLDDRL